jgi:hypothetical protein
MATLELTITAGLLIRGRIKREIQRYCWEHDIILEINEAKGWLESVMHFKMTTDDDTRIQSAARDMQRWIKENNV